MAAFQTVWSIDIGKSSLKAVKMHRERNSIEILAVDKVDYPIEAGGIESLQGPKDALQTFATRNVIDCPVIVSHPGHSAFSRFIQLPPVDAKKLEEMIGYEAQQQIPFPIDEVIWDHHVCESAAGNLEKEVGIFAVRREVISDFLIDYETSGIKPDHISIGYIGLLNYVLFDIRPQRPSVIVDIGSDHTDLLIVDGSRFWIRNLGIAGNDVTIALQEKFKLTFDEAEKLKRNAAADKQNMAKIYGVVQPVLKELVNEIHRSVGFYKSQAGDVKFEDVFLFGNAAKLLGIQHYLTEHLRFKVHVEKGFHRLRVNRESNVALLQKDFPSFASVVGNGIQGLGAAECEVNLLPQERKAELDFRSKQKVVIAAALSLFLPFAMLHWNLGKKAALAVETEKKGVVAKQLSGNDKKIQKYEKTTKKELAAESDKLLAYGKNRRHIVDGLHAINLTFASFKGDKTVSARGEDRADDLSEKVAALEVQINELNQEKVWLTAFDISQVQIDGDGKPIDRSFKGKSIPATSFVVNGMFISRGDATKDESFVRERIVGPLEKELASRKLKAKVAQVYVAGEAPTEIYSHLQGFSKSAGIKDAEPQALELYEFQLTILLHSDELPKNAKDES